MKAALVILSILACLVVVSIMDRTMRFPETPREAVKSEPVRAYSWTKVAEFSGVGQKQTDDIEITGPKYRITWAVKPGEFGTIFQVYVHDAATGQMTDLAANQLAGGSDSTILRGAGRKYLTVNSANCRWAVAVEDWR